MTLLKQLHLFPLLISLVVAKSVYPTPACVQDKTCVPVTIDNGSGETLYVMIYGSNTHTYFDFLKGSYSDTFSSSGSVISLDKDPKTFYLPGDGITGGARMYFSTHLFTGIPDLATYPYIFDKIEMGWSRNTAVWNTTSVDYFGMPIQLIQGIKKIGFKDSCTRDSIMSDLTQNMGLEANLYDERFFFKSDMSLLRVFSPQHFYTNLPNLWESAITKGLDELVLDDPVKGTGVYFNFNYGGTQFTHIRKLSNDSVEVLVNGQKQTITEINTGNAAAGQIKPIGNQFAGLLAATINRGVLGNPSHWGQNGMPNTGFPEYYYQGKPGNYLYNMYAKVLIENSIDFKTYATPYDDYWHMDSSIQVGADNNAPVTIKILPFHG
ncbi:MAG: hypothetical protein H0U75_01065 [Legionella sp.]|nr:hypothetical protein [Legionella sp.]